ncbi:hypothetical protein SeMB42_g05668 [Synchytrium endobioticum]|nr:hypothetical protein SeMB42_g05668 [Synchytrium endobioticum]
MRYRFYNLVRLQPKGHNDNPRSEIRPTATSPATASPSRDTLNMAIPASPDSPVAATGPAGLLMPTPPQNCCLGAVTLAFGTCMQTVYQEHIGKVRDANERKGVVHTEQMVMPEMDEGIKAFLELDKRLRDKTSLES